MSLSDRERFARGWGSGGKETRCGAGSTIASTAHIRPLLRPLFDEYGITSICDAGAGDLNWIRHVNLIGIDYRAFDLVPRHPDVTEWDILEQPLPACDLILCRAVLNHLNDPQVHAAIGLFKRSATYLLATHFPLAARAYTDFDPLDLRDYGLGEPLAALRDHPGELTLWRL
jgi:hypothetical protein